jgi:hypothetical protein
MRKGIEDVYRLSPLQEGLLFHALYDTEVGAYQLQDYCTMSNLDASLFVRAWQQVVDRHPVLRTAFVWKNVTNPVQIVGRQVQMPALLEDWRGITPQEQEARLRVYLHEDRVQGFKLSKAPLMRIALFRIGEETYKFVWSHHHLLLDGWSRNLMLREVFAFYEVFREGRNMTLPPRPPFKNYIQWLQEQDLAAAADFWRQALKGISAPNGGKFGDFTSGQSCGDGHGERRLRLNEETTDRIRALARSNQLTLNTLAQGAWALLLSSVGGIEDVVFGITVSGRPAELPGIETMIGMFINTLPVRITIRPEARLISWLHELQRYNAELRQFEYTPLVQIHKWSELPRGKPLFETLFVFENQPGGGDEDKPSSIRVSDVSGSEWNNFPLTLVVAPGKSLSAQIFHDRQRLQSESAARLLEVFGRILTEIADDPTRQLDELLNSLDEPPDLTESYPKDELEQFSFHT